MQEKYTDSSERDTYVALTTPLRNAVEPYVDFEAAGTPIGSRSKESNPTTENSNSRIKRKDEYDQKEEIGEIP